MTAPVAKRNGDEAPQIRCEDLGGVYRLAVVSAPRDRDAGREVLVKTLGMNSVDARIRLHHVPAVWPEKLNEPVANAAAKQLIAAGASAEAVAESNVPDLHLARTLHHVRCGRHGLDIVSIGGEVKQTVSWSSLALLSVADVGDLDEGLKGRLPNGVFRHSPGIAVFESPVEEHSLEMWLLADNPVRVFRIEADLMNYEYLGDRLTTSTGANFGLLVRDICRFTPNLFRTPSAQAFLNSSPALAYHMESARQHRDAVLAYWVTRPKRPGTDPRQQFASGMRQPSKVPPNAVGRKMQQTHLKLQQELAYLQLMCRGESERCTSSPAEFMKVLDDLAVTLDEHFAIEEEGGYLSNVLEVAPHYGRIVKELQQQHIALRDQLAQLRTEADVDVDQLRVFLEAVEAHEHAENAVAQSAFLIDLAPGD